jgi:hypothetical protein
MFFVGRNRWRDGKNNMRMGTEKQVIYIFFYFIGWVG